MGNESRDIFDIFVRETPERNDEPMERPLEEGKEI